VAVVVALAKLYKPPRWWFECSLCMLSVQNTYWFGFTGTIRICWVLWTFPIFLRRLRLL